MAAGNSRAVKCENPFTYVPEREEDWVWAASFMDEAASLFATRTCVNIVMARKNPENLFRFLSAVKVGRVVGPYESNKGIYYYRCTKQDEVYYLKELLWDLLRPETQTRWAEQETILGQ